MTRLADVLSLADLKVALNDGYVTQRLHPDDPDLRILNYTAKAQYEKAWSNVTMRCRGLIVRGSSLSHAEVVSRPWKKFFNLSEYKQGDFHPETLVSVTDKMDGSLGILYPAPRGGYAIATRGSFTSEQAIEGTRMLQQHLQLWQPREHVTYLFEIVYPENRIVVNYGDRRELVLLGIVDNASGFPLSGLVDPEWPGERVKTISAHTLAEATKLADRPNAEGIVARFLRSGTMVKLKQADYVALHKVVTGLSERTVWEHLAANAGDYSALLEQVPDEFNEWLQSVADGLLDQFDVVQGLAHDAYYSIAHDLQTNWSDCGNAAAPQCPTLGCNFGQRSDGAGACSSYRRAFAVKAKSEGSLTPLLFSLLDGKDIGPAIWRSLKPAGETPFRCEALEEAA